jgi:hypothetical protein
MAVFELVRQWSELLASWVGDGWFWVVLGYLAPRLKKGARRLLASLQGAFWDLQKNTFQRLQSVSVADKKAPIVSFVFPISTVMRGHWFCIDPIAGPVWRATRIAPAVETWMSV